MGLIKFGIALERKLDRLSTALETNNAIGVKLLTALDDLKQAVTDETAAHAAEKSAIELALGLIATLTQQLTDAQAKISQYAGIDSDLSQLAATLKNQVADAADETAKIQGVLPAAEPSA